MATLGGEGQKWQRGYSMALTLLLALIKRTYTTFILFGFSKNIKKEVFFMYNTQKVLFLPCMLIWTRTLIRDTRV